MSSRGISSTSGLMKYGTVDRYEQAAQMEQKYAEYWANKDGRTLDRITQETRDGGRDFIGMENGNKVIGEVKHWGRPVDKYTLSGYVEQANQENADLVIGATEGLTEPAHELAEKHGAEIIIGDDLPQLLHHRVLDSLSQFARSAVDATAWAANMIHEFVVKRILMTAWGWWKKLSMREKIFVGITVIAVAALIYYGRKRYQSDNESNSFFEWFSMRLRPN